MVMFCQMYPLGFHIKLKINAFLARVTLKSILSQSPHSIGVLGRDSLEEEQQSFFGLSSVGPQMLKQ